jgi:hypothetical protein
MTRAGFEPMILVFDGAKTVRAFDAGATVIPNLQNLGKNKTPPSPRLFQMQ